MLYEIGSEEVETDGSTLVPFPPNEMFSEGSKIKCMLRYIEKREYELRNGMLVRIPDPQTTNQPNPEHKEQE
jgi:hypothetical protein